MSDKLNLMEMLFFHDDKGHILSANQKALDELGYDTESELTGVFLGDIFVAEDGGQVDFRGEAPPGDASGLVAYRKNRTCFPVHIRLLRMADKEGARYLVALNVQTQANLEKEVLSLKKEAQILRKERNEFISNMTHELRTPVNGIRGHIQAMLGVSTNADDRKTYGIIQKCCEDMSYIINNILDFSKLEAGKMDLEYAAFDLYELLNHIVTANLPLVSEKGIRILLNIADNVPREVWGDEVRIGQILNNLLSNAIKFTDIGHVGIDVNKHGQYGDEIELFFVVRDTGIGIPPGQMDKLFKSFSQVDGSSTRKHGGTVLGLMISKELVGLMGGTITVESMPEKGSSFSFELHLKIPGEGATLPNTDNEESYDHGAVHGLVDTNLYENILQNLNYDEAHEIDTLYQFGSPDNERELRKKCDILILALELTAWDALELGVANLKKLLKGAPEDINKLLFRLGMAVRREEEEKCRKYYQAMMERLEEIYASR